MNAICARRGFGISAFIWLALFALVAALASGVYVGVAYAEQGNVSAFNNVAPSIQAAQASQEGVLSAQPAQDSESIQVAQDSQVGILPESSAQVGASSEETALRAGALSTQAETAYTAQVTVTIDQTSARTLLNKVNAARKAAGVANVKWDTDLENTAIQRAAEIVVMFSHTRPDGQKWNTAWPSRYGGTRGENIANGYGTADAVNQGWTNSPGHYANMIKSDFNAMAAACAVGADGRTYWVECFGKGSPTGMKGSPANGSRTCKVSVLPSNAALRVEGDTVLRANGSRTFRAILGQANLVASSANWSSSNSGVATVDASGKVVAIKGGTTTVKCAIKGASAVSSSVNLTVMTTTLSDATISYEGDDYRYWDYRVGDYVDGLPFYKVVSCPATTVSMFGQPLQFGFDYLISYQVDRTNLTASIKVYGVGDYVNTSKTRVINIIPMLFDNCSITGIPTKTYTGKPITPVPSITFTNENGETVTFERGTDFTVTWENNTKAGTATIIIKSKGVLLGTAKGTFKIAKAKNPLTVKAKSPQVKYSKTKSRTIRASKAFAVSKKVGKLSYAKVSGNKKISVSNSGKVTVKKGLKRATYKVKVKATAAGNSNYKAGSKTVTLKVAVK